MLDADIDNISLILRKYNFKFIIYSHFTDKKNTASEKVINFHRVTQTVSGWEKVLLTIIN